MDHSAGIHLRTSLLNTPLQRGDRACEWILNRFSGFHIARETAKAVQVSSSANNTPLKRGVNENRNSAFPDTNTPFVA